MNKTQRDSGVGNICMPVILKWFIEVVLRMNHSDF